MNLVISVDNLSKRYRPPRKRMTIEKQKIPTEKLSIQYLQNI